MWSLVRFLLLLQTCLTAAHGSATMLDDTTIVRNIGYLMDRSKSNISREPSCAFLGNLTNISLQCITSDFSDDSFQSFKKAKKIIERHNLSALIGDFNPQFSLATDSQRIPFFITSTVPGYWPDSPFLVRVAPSVQMYIHAISDILKYFFWKHVGILYDNEEASRVVAEVIDKDTETVRAFHLSTNSTASDARYALKSLREGYYQQFIVICSVKNTDIVLTQALYLSLLSRPNSWLIVNLGTETAALDKYRDSRVNLTSLSVLLDEKRPTCALDRKFRSPRYAILHDAVKIYKTMTDIQKHFKKMQMRRTLRQIEITGCTGLIKFDKHGSRTISSIEMTTLATLRNGSSTFFQSGFWISEGDHHTERIRPSQSYRTVMRLNDDVFGNEPLRVTTIIEPPFIQWKNETPLSDERNMTLDTMLEGFLIGILEEVSKILKFKYELSLVPDGKFGSLKSYGWTGMVRVLVDKKADIALAPFQITPSRSHVVDFTKPFMTKGTSVVVRKPERSLSPFQFLLPLSKNVWITIICSFVLTALVLFCTSRMNCDRKPRIVHNLRDSIWYTLGTLLRGNLTGSPQGVSSRIISSVWWFTSLIIVSIYTANLAAFLTISNAHIHIESAADLAYQDDYDYGTVDGSQIEYFFKHTNITHYKKMWLHMHILSPSSMVRRVENGFDRALNGKYAFLWDSPVVRHHIANHCSLMEIGSPFDLKGYGIAVQKHSPYTERLSWAILKLNDDGILYRLEGKWWRRPNCPDPRKSATSVAIEFNVASGMFIVLTGGVVVAVLAFLAEKLFYRSISKRKKKTEEEDNNANSSAPHNHVGNSVDNEKEDEIRTVLSRTLSIGENCVHHRWENDNHV